MGWKYCENIPEFGWPRYVAGCRLHCQLPGISAAWRCSYHLLRQQPPHTDFLLSQFGVSPHSTPLLPSLTAEVALNSKCSVPYQWQLILPAHLTGRGRWISSVHASSAEGWDMEFCLSGTNDSHNWNLVRSRLTFGIGVKRRGKVNSVWGLSDCRGNWLMEVMVWSRSKAAL